jgi:Zn-dependent protease with chaperone function
MPPRDADDFANSGEYANPSVPHAVNVSEKSPLADFARLTLGAAFLLTIVIGGVFFSARWWAPAIPFRYEIALTQRLESMNADSLPCARAGAAELRRLADNLAAKMSLPKDMRIQTHLSDDDDPNAIATLGGHIFIQRGILKTVSSENALAMVLAHEIAHIKRRDPIVSLGGGVAVALLLSAALGGSDGGALVGWMAGMTQTSFSRAQEAAADAEALKALRAYYGHTGGADEFFLYITKEHPVRSGMPAFASTHPAPEARVRAIQASFTPNAPALLPIPSALAACAPGHAAPIRPF